MVYFAQIIVKIEPSNMRSPHALYNGFPIFHPSIQTILKEKDPTKWYKDMLSDIADIGDRVNNTNQFGEVPLGVAAYRGAGLVVEQLLVRPEIDVNLTGRRGRTPLYLAAEEGHVYIVKLLLKHPGIDVNKGNAPAGATALMAASRRGHGRVVELLLLHPSINTDKKDRDGNNAMVHARTTSIKHRLKRRDRSRSLQDIVIHSQMGRNIGASVKSFLEAPISESNLPILCLGSEKASNNNDQTVEPGNILEDDRTSAPNEQIYTPDNQNSAQDNQTFKPDDQTYSPENQTSTQVANTCTLDNQSSTLKSLACTPDSLSNSATSLHAPLVEEHAFRHPGRTWFHRLRFHVNNSLKACCFDANRHNRKR